MRDQRDRTADPDGAPPRRTGAVPAGPAAADLVGNRAAARSASLLDRQPLLLPGPPRSGRGLDRSPDAGTATGAQDASSPAAAVGADGAPSAFEVMAEMIGHVGDEKALADDLTRLLSDDALALFGLTEEEAAEVNLSGNVIYTIIAGISAFLYFSWYYRERSIDAATRKGIVLDDDALAALTRQAKVRAGAMNLEIAPRDFLNFLLTDRPMFRDPSMDATYKTATSIVAVEALHHLFNGILTLLRKPDWKIENVVKIQRQLSSVMISLLGMTRTYLHEQGVVEKPHSGADGDRAYDTVEGWYVDNGLLWLILVGGVSVGFGAGEALEAGAEITGNIVNKLKPTTWRYVGENLVKGARKGAKVAVGGLDVAALEVFLTILKTTTIDEIDSMDHTSSLVQIAQIIFSIDDLMDAGLVVTFAVIRNAWYFLMHLSTLLTGFGAVPMGLLARYLWDLAFSDETADEALDELGRNLAAWKGWTFDQMGQRFVSHEAALDEDLTSAWSEVREFGHRWQLIFRGGLQSIARSAGVRVTPTPAE